MHVPTHILSGWCAANLFPLRPRERAFCMIAAAAPDLDGLGIIFGERWYLAFHHVVCHNLFFCIFAAGFLAAFSSRWWTFWIYLALGHLHLVMDYWGSGPLWDIYYLWPMSQMRFRNPAAWPLYSWQNITAAAILLAWTFAIARYLGRTPLEALMPDLDRQLVDLARFGKLPTAPDPAPVVDNRTAH